MNPTLLCITERIRDRSASLRQAYLARMAEQAAAGRPRANRNNFV